MGNSSSADGRPKMGSKTTCEESALGADLTGQLAIVTGCSAGLGLQTVTQLLKQGATVIMANRNQQKSQKGKETILKNLSENAKKATTNNTASNNNDAKNEAKTEAATEKTEKTETETAQTEKTDTDANKPAENKDENTNTNENTEKKEDTTTAAAASDATEEKKDATEATDATDAKADTVASQYADKIILLELDLSSLQSIYDCVTSFLALKLTIPLTFIVNNAGVMAIEKFTVSKENYEMQFATNFLGHFYFTTLLLNCPEVVKAEKGKLRVVNVSSSAHAMAPNMENVVNTGLKNKDGPSKESYSAWGNYGISKSLNILFARELANQYTDMGVQSYSLHPGVIMTELQRHMAGYQAAMLKFFGPFYLKTIPQGAATTIYCCCEDSNNLVNGGFYQDCNNSDAKKLSKALRRSEAVDKMQENMWKWAELLIEQRGFSLEYGKEPKKPVVEPAAAETKEDADAPASEVPVDAPKEDAAATTAETATKEDATAADAEAPAEVPVDAPVDAPVEDAPAADATEATDATDNFFQRKSQPKITEIYPNNDAADTAADAAAADDTAAAE